MADDVQRLAIDFENHSQQDDVRFTELKVILKGIDDKLDVLKNSFSNTSTDVAVLRSRVDSHLDGHKNGQWFAVVGLSVITLIINSVFFAIQHVSFK